MSELDSIFSDDWGEDHRSGLVAAVGRPNVGKSTLVNAILGQKIAIVTAKPQTTRQRQLGIYTNEEAQVLFIDTPGIHKPKSILGKYMVGVAHDALKDADVILWILDASAPPTIADQDIAALLGRVAPGTPRVLALNKIDLADDSAALTSHSSLCEHQKALPVSAKEGRGISELIACLIPLLPRGPRYYPADQASEANLRFLAAEIIRERIIELTSDEIPHAVAVEITRFREKRHSAQIEASIFVERGSQKGIIIGRRGDMIKRIGVESRAALEALLEARVNLETRVKVQKNWRSNAEFMRRIGYRLPKRGRN
ncbi:MAG: GTPase Era [Chloroflexi bacterium]|nr:GTPase Era [Chloroflexota bacterium]